MGGPLTDLAQLANLATLVEGPIEYDTLSGKINGQPLVSPKLIRFHELTEDEYFCTEDGAKNGVTFENTSETEPLVCLRYFGPEVNPDAPAMGAYRKNKFN